MIVNITAPPDFMMHELDEAMQVIQDTARDAQIIFGLVYKDELELGDEVLVTVIATGFDAHEDEASGGRDREYTAQYDDIDPYQRQPAPAQEQRPQSPSRTRPGAGRNLPSRSAAPVRGRRQDVEPLWSKRNIRLRRGNVNPSRKGKYPATGWYRLGNPGVSSRSKKRAEQ